MRERDKYIIILSIIIIVLVIILIYIQINKPKKVYFNEESKAILGTYEDCENSCDKTCNDKGYDGTSKGADWQAGIRCICSCYKLVK